jgi:hypothetical protein
MCDCNDEINSGEIPIGPTGPQGPQGPSGDDGPAPDIFSDSISLNTVDLGNHTFTVDPDIAWTTGQRLRVANDNATKVMEGAVVSYTGTTLIINVDYIVGSGSGSDWNISITGARGATGATGDIGAAGVAGSTGQPAFTTLTANAIPLGGTVYQLDVASSAWISVGMIIYIQSAGYYTVTSISSATRIIVNNPEYPGNSTGSLLNTKTVSSGGLQGLAGTNGTNGTNGFIYETTDGNGIAAEALDSYELLMRNSDNTGYTFVSLSDLKILLASV